MGVARGALLVLVVALLFLSFFSLNLLLTLSSSMKYENVERESSVMIKNFMSEMGLANLTEIVRQNYPMIQLYCMNNSEYILNYEGYTIDLPCSVVSQGQDAIVNEWIKDSIHGIYYTRYDCNFIDCFDKYPVPVFLLSEQYRELWTSKIFLSLIACLVLSVLVFFLVKKKANAFILSGILLIVSSLPFIKMDYILSLPSERMIFDLLWIFLSQSFYVSIKLLIVGVVLLAFGILIHIFKIGILMSNLIFKRKGKEKGKIEEKKVSKKSKKKSK